MHSFGYSSRCFSSYSARAKVEVGLINITQIAVDPEPPPSGSSIIPVFVSRLSQLPDFLAEIFVGDNCGLLTRISVISAAFSFVIKLASS